MLISNLIYIFQLRRLSKDSYKDITFVFNDVDTLPYDKNVAKRY